MTDMKNWVVATNCIDPKIGFGGDNDHPPCLRVDALAPIIRIKQPRNPLSACSP